MDESKDVPKDFIKLKSEKLSVDEVSELVISPYCGAVSLFIGTTRNNFEGKKVVHLEYEAYTSMAETEIKKICRDVRQKWPSVKHIAVHHRLGLVPITEASVIIAVSSPHRAESLEATRNWRFPGTQMGSLETLHKNYEDLHYPSIFLGFVLDYSLSAPLCRLTTYFM
ncbi:molybdopterin synthase catalytic subunit isoform X5 [Struthio camelus]|uniref:molybdopterin synthase catalytic subunit isoform X5 n=1 Tax=Struthio camelus TaxID=8801 RepID=UPI003603B29E